MIKNGYFRGFNLIFSQKSTLIKAREQSKNSFYVTSGCGCQKRFLGPTQIFKKFYDQLMPLHSAKGEGTSHALHFHSFEREDY